MWKYYATVNQLLSALYPEHDWEQSYVVKPAGYWLDKRNIMKVLDKAEKRIGIRQVL